MNNQDALSSRVLSPFALSKDDSLAIKGVAILLMIALHVYRADGINASLIPHEFPFFVKEVFWGSICIYLFAYLSGVALFVALPKMSGWGFREGIARFLHFYWIYLFCLLMGFGAMWVWPCSNYAFPNDPILWFGAFSTLNPPFPDWWYATVFFVITLFGYPLTYNILRYLPKARMWGCTLLLCVVFSIFEILQFCSENLSHDLFSRFLQHFAASIKVTSFCIMGFLMMEISHGCKVVSSVKRYEIWSCLILFFCMIYYEYRKQLPFVWGVLLLVYGIRFIRKSSYAEGVLVLLGRYSVWMWLNHRFIFGYWFAPEIYALPTPLNYLVTVIVSFLLAIVMDVIFQRIFVLCRRLTVM